VIQAGEQAPGARCSLLQLVPGAGRLRPREKDMIQGWGAFRWLQLAADARRIPPVLYRI